YRKEVFEYIKICADQFSEGNANRLFEAAYRLYHLGSKEEQITSENLSESETKTIKKYFWPAYKGIFGNTNLRQKFSKTYISGCSFMRLEFMPIAVQICIRKREYKALFIDTVAFFEEEFVRSKMELTFWDRKIGIRRAPSFHPWWHGLYNP
ncbi:hypothetical protein PFISCL1PPCAC_25458, partial [Pristionchus fissidentatus]